MARHQHHRLHVLASRARPPSSTAMDVVRATLNGEDVDVSAAADGRLPLPALAADNVLVVEASTSQHRHRRRHPAHGRPHRQAGLRLDQPSSPTRPAAPGPASTSPTSRHPTRFVVTAPESWTVTTNCAPDSVEDAETDDARRVDLRRHAAALDVRRGRQRRARSTSCASSAAATTWASTAASRSRRSSSATPTSCSRSPRQGLAFFGERFGQPFPQERYDQVFVPDMGGAMENWGCVTWTDSVLFRSAADPRPARRAGRVPAARDGAHVVRRPRHDALVGRPVAQRGVRVLGGQLGLAWAHRVHRRVGHASSPP